MKKAIVSFALVLVLSMSSFAGNKEKNERREKCEFPCEQMVKDLNLSEKQLSQLKADKTFDTEVKAIREKKKEFEKSNRESMKAAKVRRDSTFKSILTKDQYIQYLEQKVARLEKRAARDSWRERFRAPFMGKDMKQGRLNPLPWSEKNVEK
mgnify:CR=1 FL=1